MTEPELWTLRWAFITLSSCTTDWYRFLIGMGWEVWLADNNTYAPHHQVYSPCHPTLLCTVQYTERQWKCTLINAVFKPLWSKSCHLPFTCRLAVSLTLCFHRSMDSPPQCLWHDKKPLTLYATLSGYILCAWLRRSPRLDKNGCAGMFFINKFKDSVSYKCRST